jgi:amino acid permease
MTLPNDLRDRRLSVVFIVNQIYGPGVLAIPIVYQQAGVFPTLLALLFFFVVSSFASTMLCDSMAMIPGAHSHVHFVFGGIARMHTTIIAFK